MTLRPVRRSAPRTAPRVAPFAFAAALAVGLGACGRDPFAINWTASPDTVLLYSLARPELNLSSGYNFFGRRAVRIESATATGSWDVALDTRGGELVFLPPGALGVSSRARITALPGMRFDDVIDAPSDTAVYTATAPVPIEMGSVYVVRTGRSVGAFGRRCSYYAKLEPLVVDVQGGTLTFVFDVSPVCNSLRLVPPD